VTRLALRGLACGYGARALVAGCELVLEPGAAAVIVGRNGAGKSTILRTVAGTLQPLAGRVEIDGIDVHGLEARRRARAVAMLMQIQTLDPALTVRELVELGRTPHVGMFGNMRAADRAAVDEAIAICRLEALAGRPLGKISGGERQRSRLAMVLAQQTPVVLLDEPTSHLDVGHRYMLHGILARIRKERGAVALIVAHSLEDAVRFGDSIVYVDGGLTRAFCAHEIHALRGAIEESSSVPPEWVY
jgi:iron complex transport system ATP-binding protein